MDYAIFLQYGASGVLVIVLIFFYKYVQSEQAKSEESNKFIREQAAKAEQRANMQFDKMSEIASASVGSMKDSANAIKQMGDYIERIAIRLDIQEKNYDTMNINITSRLDKIDLKIK